MVSQIKELAHLALESGICRHLQPDNRCEIYEDRPEACRVDASFARVENMLCIERWHEINYRSCLALMCIQGIGEDKAAPIREALEALM